MPPRPSNRMKNHIWLRETREHTFEAEYAPCFEKRPVREYPAWRYHQNLDPILVSDTEADEAAKKKGYDAIVASMISNKMLVNWFWDIEDMSPRQLTAYAKEEYAVDFPIDAKQESLMKAVLELGKFAPQNRGRIALMAHTIKMNYEETQEEIRRTIRNEKADVERMVLEL